MALDFSPLADQPRFLMDVTLEPVQGTRFQPTGFPDLGAATYTLHDGTEMLLVESAQSMANRLENVCWDEAAGTWKKPLGGLPYVQSTLPDGTVTNSVLEAHRLNSPYIVRSEAFDTIKSEIGFEKSKPFDRRRLAKTLLKYDPCSLLHGIFLEKVGGVVRLPRILSSFIEAANVAVAANGGVKFDRVQPETGDSTPYGKAAEGYGNVPYHRDDYTGKIKAYFNLDLALLRGYGLGSHAEILLIAVSLYKIQAFLHTGLRLRTACDLKVAREKVEQQPEAFQVPTLTELELELPGLIMAAKECFATPPVTSAKYKKA